MTLLDQLNPFDLPGPQFLLLYVITLIAAFVIAVTLRRRFLRSEREHHTQTITLDPYEAAYLRGGADLATNTAIATLVQSKVLQVSSAGSTLAVVAGAWPSIHPFEQALYRTVSSNAARDIKTIRSIANEDAGLLAERLETLGLVATDAQARMAHLIPGFVMAAVLAFGIIKIGVGISRDRPVGLLFLLCFVVGVIALVFFIAPAHRTRLGDKVLIQLRDENAALESTARTHPQILAAGDVSLAMALFGIEALAFADESWLGLRSALAPPRPSSDGSSSSCGSSSGGCGGGCGGGGCGGCGG